MIEKDKWTLIRIRKSTAEMLKAIQKKLRYATYDDVLNFLIEKNKQEEEK